VSAPRCLASTVTGAPADGSMAGGSVNTLPHGEEDGRPADPPNWEPASKVADEELRASGGAIRSVACTASGAIVTSSSRPVVKVWKVAEAAVVEDAKLQRGAVGSSCVEVASDNNTVAVCYDDGCIGLWDLRNSR